MTDATINKIPEWIPTWVVVTAPVFQPVPTAAPVEMAATVASSSVETPVVHTEGKVDKAIKSITIFLAKIFNQPHPVTGEVAVKEITTASIPSTAPEAPKQNIIEKTWDKLNKVVETAWNVASEAVKVTTDTVNKATETMKEIIPPPAATPQQSAPIQSLDNLPK